jgi:hypothetical protein
VDEEIEMKRLLRFTGGYLLLNLFIVGFLILFNGVRPTTTTGWIILFVIALPLWVLAEWVGEKLTSKPVSRSIDDSDKQVSILRMMYLLGAMIVCVAVLSGLWAIFGNYLKPYFK